MAIEVGEPELLDPSPDIHHLFSHYNSLYFRDSLGPCVVSWSSSRMTSCAGICKYLRGGCCEIRLSEPLLKFRSTADLKNTLLHEMIHAFLWIKEKDKKHSEHGPSFQAIMNAINSSFVSDHQRPSGGYNITIFHEFHEEVDSYRVHHWLCQSCGDLIKRAMNREPSASDCMENLGHATACSNSSCHWHRHRMLCSGSYTKIAEPPGYKDRRRAIKGVPEKEHLSNGSSRMTRLTTKRLCETEETKGNPGVKKTKTITNFFPFVVDGNRNSCNSSRSGDASKSEVKCKGLTVFDSMTHHSIVDTEVPKRRRTPTSRKKRDYICTKRVGSGERKDQCPVMSAWLGYYAEEETDEDVEPLINKRTERRKKQKLLKCGKGKAPEVEAMDGVPPSHASGYRFEDHGCTKYPLLGYGDGGGWRHKGSLGGLCEDVSPLSSAVRDEIIDVSDG